METLENGLFWALEKQTTSFKRLILCPSKINEESFYLKSEKYILGLWGIEKFICNQTLFIDLKQIFSLKDLKTLLESEKWHFSLSPLG